MDKNKIVCEFNDFLLLAAAELAGWLSDLLPQTSKTWWEDSVLDKLSYYQRKEAEDKKHVCLSSLELSALLRITDKNWYTIQNVVCLPTKKRECIRAMQIVRNNWTHCSRELPGKDTIVKDLDTLCAFFEQFGTSNNIVSRICNFKDEISAPGGFKAERDEKEHVLTAAVQSAGTITAQSLVYLVGNPTERGVVLSVESLGEIDRYQVFVGNTIKTFYSNQIALVEDTPKYNWIDLNTFQSYLSAYQINHPSADNLYSLNSARIDFVPYQFRPALKLIKSDEPRILIADSVGVGKTIEAGLIIKELEARNELENIVIICPKPLVTERKWEMEMKRFDEEFVPLDGKTLRQIISDVDRDGEWPSRFSKAIIPYSILDQRVFEGDDKKKRYIGFENLDPAPHFNLVIVDEAHHIRNGSTAKEKAFAYKCTKYICDHADAVVLLTATPIQTSDDDLYTLLNLLRPDIVIDKPTFRMMAKPNAHISTASSLARAAKDGWQASVLEELSMVLLTRWGKNVIAKNPLYEKVVAKLQLGEMSREDRVKLISDIESLHSFNTMLNRTRRKDIQDFCVRRAHTIETAFTPVQQELHDELLNFEAEALAELHNEVQNIPFMMSTIRRQAASCIFGLGPHIRDLLERRLSQTEDDLDVDIDGFEWSDKVTHTLLPMAKRILALADNLPDDDPKFDAVFDVIQQKLREEKHRIMLFSTFRHTLAYIKKKLMAKGIRVEQVDGSIKDNLRCEYRNRFSLPKDNPDAIDVLLFTEVGSEGLDYQFCDMMINYDLPWNPMRIEQRIGRIDRRGQTSEVVNIYNVITDGTVDADIYRRCLKRIGVFEKSIGECEAILLEIGKQVKEIVLNSTLTDEERCTKLQQMADNEVRRIQELTKLEDEEQELFGFDLSGYSMTKEIEAAENEWLSAGNLQFLVERYLEDRLGKGKRLIGDGDIKKIRLSVADRNIMLEDYRGLSNVRSTTKKKWEIYLKGGNPNQAITFAPEAAAASLEKNVFFITATHPLVKQAARYYSDGEIAHICLLHHSDVINPGLYPFSVYAWNYVGTTPHFRLVVFSECEEVEKEFLSIIRDSSCLDAEELPSSIVWSELERKQAKKLYIEREQHIDGVRLSMRYKLESVENSYQTRKRSLEQFLKDATHENIQRMRESEIEKITGWHERKTEEIKKQIDRADVYSSLIANGILRIERV